MGSGNVRAEFMVCGGKLAVKVNRQSAHAIGHNAK